MDKIREKLLEKFKKASIPEREKMAKKFGFDTIEAFFKDLTDKIYGMEEPKVEGKKVEEKKEEVVPMDVVIAFDTTGSMNAYIEAVRQYVKDTIAEMFKNVPDLMMKIVAFGDYCDMDKPNHAYQEVGLTDNQNDLVKFVTEASNTSGGDENEFYELVIKKVVEETSWRKGSRRLFILIADNNPHPLGYNCSPYVINNQIDWRVEARRAADLGIQIDTFKIIPSNKWYDELSQITNGVCIDFKSSAKIEEILRASIYFRTDKAKFRSMSVNATRSGDAELIGAYKSLSSKLDD